MGSAGLAADAAAVYASAATFGVCTRRAALIWEGMNFWAFCSRTHLVASKVRAPDAAGLFTARR